MHVTETLIYYTSFFKQRSMTEALRGARAETETPPLTPIGRTKWTSELVTRSDLVSPRLTRYGPRHTLPPSSFILHLVAHGIVLATTSTPSASSPSRPYARPRASHPLPPPSSSLLPRPLPPS
ncbi:hypothetical protein QVD17_05670 [Tagetes erecta]|uniref:Uncharacterized protein n=1 Tax=Tagetes erecta TaxID=13708 RepID=A0AAD8PAR4_TARER|nr:hypothetical protein QVD17_05670 [Tagetes erecta]